MSGVKMTMYNTRKFLKDIDNAKEQEYLVLREAVWKRMEAQRTISSFVFTTTLAFYTIVFAAEIKAHYVFLIPFLILMPFSCKELSHKISISYIASYQIVCLENNHNVANAFTWETDFFLFKKKGYLEHKQGVYRKIVDLEFLMLGIISYVLYLVYFIVFNLNKNTVFCLNNVFGVILAVISFALVLAIGRVTYEYNEYTNSTEFFVKKWLKYMLEEKRIDKDTYKMRYKELIGKEPEDTKNSTIDRKLL